MIRKSMFENTDLQIAGDEKNIRILNEIFENVELTQEEERCLIWLSTFEKSTVKNIISAFKKALKK